MRRKAACRRAAFTLVEAIAALVIFAVSAPTIMFLLADASAARADAVQTARATWFASAVLEHALADVYSQDGSLGFDALDNPSDYIADLNERIDDDLIDFYNDLGFSHQIQIDDVQVNQSGGGWRAIVNNTLADPEHRQITVTVAWTRTNGRSASLSVRVVAADL